LACIIILEFYDHLHRDKLTYLILMFPMSCINKSIIGSILKYSMTKIYGRL